ncbi:Os02g0212800 [Oryza sativa Japonica Group]|uniref:Os02g0212800 protein n=1 Tax=Oryza sativa subsp. japonica TaxID=39947 RepID=A0A0P0VGB5_ORYSJ|nr:Os02g0212800 [Oryza sativa Japonica Group]
MSSKRPKAPLDLYRHLATAFLDVCSVTTGVSSMAAAIERAAAAVDNGDEECNGGAQQWRRQCRTLLGQCSAMAVAEELEAEVAVR